MIYKTLHTYIFRELLRVFLLTAAALTTLLAFGGTFKPLTKQGIEVTQLMLIMLNLMPAMLAYAIPIAALFAAVLVYWRMSTDNELTACRAGGISFMVMVMPAFLLGFTVASVDLVFVNYVVPRFLQSTERAVMRDLGKLLVSQIGRQEKFQYDLLPIVVSADSAQLQATDDPNVSKVILQRMAAVWLENGKPTAIVVAPQAVVTIENIPSLEAVDISFTLTDSTSFNPGNAFETVTATVDSQLFNGRPIRIPSLFRSKPKFLNLRDLRALSDDPYKFAKVADAVDRIETQHDYQAASVQMEAWWQKASAGGKKPVDFQTPDDGAGAGMLRVYASEGEIDSAAPPEQSLSFKGAGPNTVKIEQWTEPAGAARGKLIMTYTCDAASLTLSRLEDGAITGYLRPVGRTVGRQNFEQGTHDTVTDALPLAIVLPGGIGQAAAADDDENGDSSASKAQLVSMALQSKDKGVRLMGQNALNEIEQLDRTIGSELHSRVSFSLSCLTLVMLGAALGILLRGKNPLAVFVVGFVPAILMVLLITAGREVTEGGGRHVTSGIALIWAGNAVLLAVVLAVYSKLLRQ